MGWPRSLAYFCVWVLLLTGLDYLLHGDLYNYRLVDSSLQGGLLSSPEWVLKNQLIYLALWQAALLMILDRTRCWSMFFLQEAFYLSDGKDLVFYMWNGFNYPVGEWTWMGNYNTYGTWNTWMQVFYTATIVLSTILIILTVKNTRYNGQTWRINKWRNRK